MGFFFKRSSIFNVRMVITEEKILSNIEKLKKLIDPEEEKLVVRLEEDRYFKDLVESITVYLINYPSKNQFPLAVYEAAYNLVEFVTAEFEKNSVKAEELLEKRNKFLKESYLLKDALITVKEKKEGWIENLSAFEGKFSEDIAEALTVIANSSIKDEKEVDEAEKMVNSKISSLESNLYLEIDLDNIESESRALSFVGIEIAEALKHVNPPNAEDGSKKKTDFNLEKMKEVDISEFKSDKNEYEIIVNSGELAFTKSMEQFVGNSEDAYIEEDSIADNFFKETIIPKKLTLWDRFKQTRIFKKLYCFFNIKVTLDYPQIEENSSYYMTENNVNEQQNVSFM